MARKQYVATVASAAVDVRISPPRSGTAATPRDAGDERPPRRV